MHVENTAAIVTGGASGLGAATALELAKRGATVFAFDLASSIEASEKIDGVHYVAVDVTDPEQVHEAVAEAAGAGVPLRTVVNCAGIGPSARILSRNGVHDLALYAKIVQVNLVGSFNVLASPPRRSRRPKPSSTASAASSSTPPASRRTTARSARRRTPPPRAASSA
jgi:NAD(P)-dependent dehydrogenase (short-subunit alcohol dehydrogenase family)